MAATARELLIIRLDPPSENDAAVSALADFLGIGVRFADLATLLSGGLFANDDNGLEPAAIGAQALAAVILHGLDQPFRAFLKKRVSSLLVYGVEPTFSISKGLAMVTDGQVTQAVPSGAGRYACHVSPDSPEICGQLAGISAGPVSGADVHLLDTVSGPGVAKLITLSGRPFFVSAATQAGPVFIIAATRVDDVRTFVSARPEAASGCVHLFPAAMYLKWAFGKAAWRREKSRACLIVDDPLLKEGYGFLNFQNLAEMMDTCDFATSVGFIPWNFRRTGRKTADLFRERKDRLSLCVHGCDHTQGEFGLSDAARLGYMARTATERMERHANATQLPFDNVMVFPQGIFSVPAMQALKANGYIAAINFDVFPVDSGGPIEMKALLEPAVTAFGGFPLFLRRRPEETAEIASDLFWGCPAFIMAHHDFFRDRRRAIEAVMRVNAIEGGVEWRSIGEIVRRSHLLKEGPEGMMQVKGYVAEMLIENPEAFERACVVTKPEPSAPLAVSLQSGRPIAWQHAASGLRLSFTIGPRARECVVITYPRDVSRPADAAGLAAAIGTGARRYLSEIRDNYISRNDTLLTIAGKIKDCLLP